MAEELNMYNMTADTLRDSNKEALQRTEVEDTLRGGVSVYEDVYRKIVEKASEGGTRIHYLHKPNDYLTQIADFLTKRGFNVTFRVHSPITSYPNGFESLEISWGIGDK